MEVLSAMFPGRWIGMSGSFLWPPRSTDSILLDFFFWDYIKNYIYMGTIQDLYHLKTRISEANEQVIRYATDMVKSGILIGHMQGHEW
jgi:hypothetical protein